MPESRLPALLTAVAAGGALGSLARFGLSVAFSGSVLSTVLVNVTGCLLIGVLLTSFGDRPLPRAFLATGVLGGYTTYSTFVVDALRMSPVGALTYVFGTLASCLGAVALGVWLARR